MRFPSKSIDFHGVLAYSKPYFEVYWGSNAATKLDLQALATLGITAAVPSCSGSSCAEIEISRASAMVFTISRGPYRNSESALITLPAAGTVTVNTLNTESGWDFLYIGSERFSGTQSNIERSVPALSTIEWRSDGSITRNGWSLTYTAGGSESLVSMTLPTSTIPATATHFLASRHALPGA